MESLCFEMRPARVQDMDTIYELIRELAVYEKKDPSKLPLTKENLLRFGFGQAAYFYIELAEVGSSIVAYALYFYPFSANQGKPYLFVEDLYVKPEFRGKGIGEALLKKLASKAEEIGCCRMEWQVFDWNEDAVAFYKKIGGTVRKDLLVVRLEKDAMIQFAQ